MAAVALALGTGPGAQAADPSPDASDFEREVNLRLEVPAQEQEAYAGLLQAALAQAGVDAAAQYFVLVDRSANVQAGILFWRSPEGAWRFIGASPVATGIPGGFEHFLTPLGVFEHSLANPDFRAEGTRNALGICGYGRKGMRVYDFGWVDARRTWGSRSMGRLRLQMHATDSQRLEPLLGRRHSKGCIRIPATLDLFIDRYGLLDADYEAAVRAGHPQWVLRPDRQPTAWPGRWLVVVESSRGMRPDWAAKKIIAKARKP